MSNTNRLPANLSCHIFDSLVRPILTFNSEIWYMDVYRPFYNSERRVNNNEKSVNNYFNFIDRSIVDKVHTKFCKFTLGVKKCASNLAARSDLGRYPVDYFIKTQSLLYEDRLHQNDINPLLKESYSVSKLLHLKGIYSWFTYIDHVRSNNQLCVCNNAINQNMNCSCKISVNKVLYKRELGNQYIKKYEEKLQNLDTNSKLILFKSIQFNHPYNLQYYLRNFNFEYRKLICKFRISDHSLEIEKGRYKKIPRNERICKICNTVDNEAHFFFDCSINDSLRNRYLQTFNFEPEINPEDKLKQILNPDTNEQVRLLGSFLKQSLLLRTGDS